LVEAAETLREVAWWRRQEAGGRRELRGARSPVEAVRYREGGGHRLPRGRQRPSRGQIRWRLASWRRPPDAEKEAASFGRQDLARTGHWRWIWARGGGNQDGGRW